MKPRWTLLLLVLVGCSGCVTLSPARPVADVQQRVHERTGRMVPWLTGSREDEQVAQSVAAMLAGELRREEAVQIALLRNPMVQAQFERLGIAQAQLVQAGLLTNPVFEGSFRFVAGAGGRGILEMSVLQDFLDVLLIPLRREYAGINLERVQAQVARDLVAFVTDVEVAYVRAQAASQALDLEHLVLEAADLEYEMGKRIHQVGNLRDLDLANHRARYEQAKLDVAEAELDALERGEQLNLILGLWGDETLWRLPPELPPVPYDVHAEDVERQAVAASLDLAVSRLEMTLVAARGGLELAERLFPSLELGADSEREADGEWSVGPALVTAIPIFDQGQAARAVARAEVRGQTLRHRYLAIEVRTASRRLWYRVQTRRRQAEYYQRVMVPLRHQLTQLTQLQYNAMQVGVFALLDAKRREIHAQRQAIEAVRDSLIAELRMRQLLAGSLPRDEVHRLPDGMQANDQRDDAGQRDTREPPGG